MSKPPAASASPVRKDKPAAATPSSAAPPVVAPAVAAGASSVNCWIMIIPIVGLLIAFGAGVYHRISLTLDLNHMADPINNKTGRWIPLQYEWKDGDLMEGSTTARWIGNVSLQHLNGDAYETENNERHCVFQTNYVPAGNSAAATSTNAPPVDFKSKGFEDVVAVRPNIAIGCAGNLGSAFNNASMGSVGLNTPPGSCIVVRIPPSGDCTGDSGCEDKSSNEPKLAINELPVIGLPIFEGDGKTIAFHPHGVYHLLAAENDVNPTWDVLYVINHAFDRGGERIEVFNITNLDANTPDAPIQLVYLYSVVDPFVQEYMMGNLDDIVATSATEVFLTTWHERPDNVRGAAFDGTGGVAIQLEDVAARLVGLPLAYLVHCTWSVDKSSKGVIVPGSSSCRAVATKFYIGNGISRASGLLARLRPELREYLFAVDTAGKTVHLIQLTALRRKEGAKASSENDPDDRPEVSALNEWISVHLLGNAPVVSGFARHRQSVYAYRTLDNIEFDKFDVDAYGKDSTTLHFFTGSLIRGLGLNDPSVSTRLSITVPPVAAAAPPSNDNPSGSRSLQITRVAQQDIGLTKELLSVSGSTLLRNGDRRVVVSGAWNNTGLFSCTLLPQKP